MGLDMNSSSWEGLRTNTRRILVLCNHFQDVQNQNKLITRQQDHSACLVFLIGNHPWQDERKDKVTFQVKEKAGVKVEIPAAEPEERIATRSLWSQQPSEPWRNPPPPLALPVWDRIARVNPQISYWNALCNRRDCLKEAAPPICSSVMTFYNYPVAFMAE